MGSDQQDGERESAAVSGAPEDGLFRAEASQSRQAGPVGEPFVARPLSIAAASLALSVGLLSLILFAATLSFPASETVPGQVAPSGGLIRIVSPTDGFVSRLPVSEGSSLGPGAEVAVLRTLRIADGRTAGEDAVSRLETRMGAEQAAAATQIRSAEDRRAGLVRQRLQAQTQVSEAKVRLQLLSQREQLARATFERAGPAHQQGYLSENNYAQLQSTYLAAQQEVSQARDGLISAERSLSDLDVQINALTAQIEVQRNQATAADAGLLQQLSDARASNATVVTVPTAGQILALPVNPGQAISRGGLLAVLAPRGATLEAELLVPSKSIGFVRPGQKVRLRYDAFPSQRFGSGEGVIVSVSRTVLSPSDLQVTGMTSAEPVFRVRVKLKTPYVSAYGVRYPLQPGLRLQADIIVSRTNLLRWIMEPLLAGRRA